MLYERWLDVARENKGLALRDLASDQRWSFQELVKIGEAEPGDAGPVAFPSGISAQFIFTVLQGWRRNQIICPLEIGQAKPQAGALPSHLVHLKTTSATTGTARVVGFTAEQLAADADNIVITMGLRPEWPNLGAISLAHSYGFSNLVLPLLLHGIPLVLVESPLPEMVRRALETTGPMTVAAVPALWRTWHEGGVLARDIRLAISAGAALPQLLEQQVHEKDGLKIHNFYGATECGGIAYDRSDVPRADPACVGGPMHRVRLSRNAEDCLEVRGPAVGETYWPVAAPELSGGCYRTSDLVELREDLVFLRGRATDQINVAGRKVFPETIESVLRGHPEVRECVVFGVSNGGDERGDVIVACVARRSTIGQEELKQFVLHRLPAWQAPRHWWFVETLASNQRGKLSRAEWRDRYRDRKQTAD